MYMLVGGGGVERGWESDGGRGGEEDGEGRGVREGEGRSWSRRGKMG